MPFLFMKKTNQYQLIDEEKGIEIDTVEPVTPPITLSLDNSYRSASPVRTNIKKTIPEVKDKIEKTKAELAEIEKLIPEVDQFVKSLQAGLQIRKHFLIKLLSGLAIANASLLFSFLMVQRFSENEQNEALDKFNKMVVDEHWNITCGDLVKLNNICDKFNVDINNYYSGYQSHCQAEALTLCYDLDINFHFAFVLMVTLGGALGFAAAIFPIAAFLAAKLAKASIFDHIPLTRAQQSDLMTLSGKLNLTLPNNPHIVTIIDIFIAELERLEDQQVALADEIELSESNLFFLQKDLETIKTVSFSNKFKLFFLPPPEETESVHVNHLPVEITHEILQYAKANLEDEFNAMIEVENRVRLGN